VQRRRDRIRDFFPLPRLVLELLSSLARKAIKLGAPIVLGRTPRRGEPSGFLQPVERGKQRARLDGERFVRDLLNAACDAEAVQVLEGQSAENEQIERTLKQRGRASRHDFWGKR